MTTVQVVRGAGDALRRTARGFFQLTFAEAIIRLLEVFNIVSWNEDQHIAVLAVLTPIVTAIQNYLEDNTAMPAILKAPASSGENPTPDPEAGKADPVHIIVIVALVLLVLYLIKVLF